MKKSKFTEQQTAFILKQADDGGGGRGHLSEGGVSIQTYCRRRQK